MVFWLEKSSIHTWVITKKNLFVLLKAVAKTFRSMPGYTPTVPAPQLLNELLVAQGDARWEEWKVYTTNVGTKKSTL